MLSVFTHGLERPAPLLDTYFPIRDPDFLLPERSSSLLALYRPSVPRADLVAFDDHEGQNRE
jgi:hypothetical protein